MELGTSGLDQGSLAGIDTSTPSVARVYDAVLNGKDNFAVDRAVRDQLLQIRPEGLVLPRDNRAWLFRIVRYLTDTVGIDQFLDCGSGLPSANNTHQVAQQVNPQARVVYVDHDPVVLAHGRALLEENRETRFVAADIRDPERLVAQAGVGELLDLTQPVGLLHAGVLHHVDDEEDPVAIMRRYVQVLPSGSYVAISHFHNPGDGSEVAEAAQAAEEVLSGGELGSGRFRSPEEINELFVGLPLVEPGLVPLAEWWPLGPPERPLAVPRQLMLGGLAQIP